MKGTSEHGDRLILVSEEMFRQLLEKDEIATGRKYTVAMGEPHIDAVMWYEPTIYTAYPHPDQLTLAETGE